MQEELTPAVGWEEALTSAFGIKCLEESGVEAQFSEFTAPWREIR